MANYYSQGRTNYFRVKDEEKFEQRINSIREGSNTPVDLIKDERGWCLLFEEGAPTFYYNEETGEERDVDMEGLIRENLADGSVCVMMEIGAEKLRFLDGWSIAFNNKGDRKVVLLDDVYKGIESFGECTQCEW